MGENVQSSRNKLKHKQSIDCIEAIYQNWHSEEYGNFSKSVRNIRNFAEEKQQHEEMRVEMMMTTTTNLQMRIWSKLIKSIKEHPNVDRMTPTHLCNDLVNYTKPIQCTCTCKQEKK